MNTSTNTVDMLNIANQIKASADNINSDLEDLQNLYSKLKSNSYWNGEAANYYTKQLSSVINTNNIEQISESLKQCSEYIESVVNNIELANFQIEHGITLDLSLLK